MIDLLNKIENTAIKAGNKILEIYESSDFGVQIKGDDSPLTKADLAAHNVIVKDLASYTPDTPILSEESTTSCRLFSQASAIDNSTRSKPGRPYISFGGKYVPP